MIGNLLSNAIEYSGGSTIEISQFVGGRYIEINVADTGCGINTATSATPFERFYRIDKGRSRRAGGTGLGLAIVKTPQHGTAALQAPPCAPKAECCSLSPFRSFADIYPTPIRFDGFLHIKSKFKQCATFMKHSVFYFAEELNKRTTWNYHFFYASCILLFLLAVFDLSVGVNATTRSTFSNSAMGSKAAPFKRRYHHRSLYRSFSRSSHEQRHDGHSTSRHLQA